MHSGLRSQLHPWQVWAAFLPWHIPPSATPPRPHMTLSTSPTSDESDCSSPGTMFRHLSMLQSPLALHSRATFFPAYGSFNFSCDPPPTLSTMSASGAHTKLRTFVWDMILQVLVHLSLLLSGYVAQTCFIVTVDTQQSMPKSEYEYDILEQQTTYWDSRETLFSWWPWFTWLALGFKKREIGGSLRKRDRDG